MAKAPTATVIPDSLYALALAYKKTKLWKLLWDSQLFAVKMADGEIGYCCVMGMNGEHTALAVYVGQDGIDSYRNIANGENFDVCDADGNAEPTFQSHEKMMSQNCIQCSLADTEPCDDDKKVTAGLVSATVGTDRSAEAEPIKAPNFPLAMLAFDSESQVIVSTAIIPKLDAKGYATMIHTLAETIADKGKPTSFLVKKHDRRTKTVLKAFAEQTGIEIAACDDEDGDLLNAEMDLLECMSGENSKVSDDGFQKALDDMTEQLMGISDADLRKMPSDMRDVLLSEAHAGHLDKELAQRLIHVFEGR